MAYCIYSEFITNARTWYILGSSSKKTAYRFTAPISGTVNMIFCNISYAISPPAYEYGIQGDNAGVPDGVYITSTIIPTCATGDSILATPTPSANLTSGNVYHLVFEYESGLVSSSNYAGPTILNDFGDTTHYPSEYCVDNSAVPSYKSAEDSNLLCQVYDGAAWTTKASNQRNPVFGLTINTSTIAQPIPTASELTIYTSTQQGETITLTDKSRKVSHVGFFVTKAGAPAGSLDYAILSGTNPVRSGTLADAASVGAYAWIDAKLSSALTLDKGTTYRAVLSSTNSANAANSYITCRILQGSGFVESFGFGGTDCRWTRSLDGGATFSNFTLSDVPIRFTEAGGAILNTTSKYW